jgi:hypothetical protein
MSRFFFKFTSTLTLTLQGQLILPRDIKNHVGKHKFLAFCYIFISHALVLIDRSDWEVASLLMFYFDCQCIYYLHRFYMLMIFQWSCLSRLRIFLLFRVIGLWDQWDDSFLKKYHIWDVISVVHELMDNTLPHKYIKYVYFPSYLFYLKSDIIHR